MATEYVQGMNVDKITQLEDNIEEPTKRLVEDVKLFGEWESSAR